MNNPNNSLSEANIISRMFEMAEQYFDRSITWLDAGEPVSVNSAGDAAEHRIEIKGLPIDTGFQSLPNHSFDVISLINITEHTKNAYDSLQEAVRVLKQDGFIYLTTQDPVFLTNAPLHLRPPSYWMMTLKNLNMNACIRFGAGEQHVEILAAHKDFSVFNSLKSSFQAVRSVCSSRLSVNNSHIQAVTRSALPTNRIKDSAGFYVLNSHAGPMSLRLQLRLQEQQNPDVFIGDCKMRYEGMKQEDGEYLHRWKALTVPPGGHNCKIISKNKAVSILRMEWHAEESSAESFVMNLPFDHYQRYRITTDIMRAMPSPPKTVLDVGGAKGFIQLFIKNAEAVVLDRAMDDMPNSLRYDGNALPFPDQSFDVVVSIDTLEHVPPDQRSGFIKELCRVSTHGVILACPFDEQHVDEADSIIRDFSITQLGKADRFLSEHEEFSLPNREAIHSVFTENGFSVAEFPNGYLPRWVVMQMATFAMGVSPELHEARAHLNAIYNKTYYPADNCSPAYRYVMLATKKPVDVTMMQSLRHTISPTIEAHKEFNLSPALVALSTFGVIREKDAALVSSENRIDELLKHVQNLESRLEEETVERKKLLEHARNMDGDLKANTDHIQRLDEHSINLQKLNGDLQSHIKNQEKTIEHAQAEQASLSKHIGNMDEVLKSREDHIQNLQKHADNLAAVLAEKDEHQSNLNQHAENLSAHILFIEQQQLALEQQQSALEQQTGQLQHELNLSQLQNKISHWYFNTFLPRLHEPGCNGKIIEDMLYRLDSELGELPEFIQQFLTGMKSLCESTWKEKQAMQSLEADLQSIRSSTGYKLMSKSGVIPKGRKPETS
jgi:ubiquinone/menaquinone biosynthesis C-methylase UbiE